jgi:hypothetical protein
LEPGAGCSAKPRKNANGPTRRADAPAVKGRGVAITEGGVMKTRDLTNKGTRPATVKQAAHDPLVCGLGANFAGVDYCPACAAEDEVERVGWLKRQRRARLPARPAPTRDQLCRAYRLIRRVQADVDEVAVHLAWRCG